MEAAMIDRASAELDLVARHRYGDPDAFEEIYRSHSAMVYNLASRLSGDRAEAADLTQEIFLRIFRHLDRFRGSSSLKTWIYRVALNHCRSRLSRRRFAWLTFGGKQGEPADPRDPSPGPEARALNDDLSSHLSTALRQLPAAFREAVVLRDLEGLDYQEIATVLGIRLGTVRSRIARGRAQLRGLLEEFL